MKRVEKWFAVFLLLVFVGFFFLSFDYNMFARRGGIGEGFIPRVVSGMLIVLMGIHMLGIFRGKPTVDEENTPTKPMVMSQILLGIMLIITLYLIPILGMLLALGVFILFSARFIEKVSWVKSIIFSVASVVSFFFIFIQWLGIRLPLGIFF